MSKQRIEQIIEAYLKTKAESWSPSTLRSEGYRLRGVTLALLEKPDALYKYFIDERGMKPYSLKTAWIRAGELLDFAMSTGALKPGVNKIKAFMVEKANLFKHAYEKKAVGITFQEAAIRIARIEDAASREKAVQLLFTGMRWAESQTLKDGKVIAKGGHKRDVKLADGFDELKYQKHYITFWKHLKQVGLKPHDLRKLCATQMAEDGATVADLMTLFGWSNSQTPALYVQAQKEKELVDKMKARRAKEKNAKQVSQSVPKDFTKAASIKGK